LVECKSCGDVVGGIVSYCSVREVQRSGFAVKRCEHLSRPLLTSFVVVGDRDDLSAV
jgi:hypothetical protein